MRNVIVPRTRTCDACATGITEKNKSGKCRSCLMKARFADPEWKAMHVAALRAASGTVESRAKKSAAGKRVYADPSKRLVMSEAKKRAMADPVKRANVAAAAKETLRKWHETTDRDWSAWHRDRHMQSVPWCPADRYDELLAMSKKVGRPEAERMMREDIEAKRRAADEAMSPFERQMARVAAGAQLIDKPDFRKAAHAYTLGGVSPEAM